MARDSRWSWRSRQTRRDPAIPRGGATPAAHMHATADDPGAVERRRHGGFAGPRLPAQLIDAGTTYGAGGPVLVDTEPRDHFGTDIGIGWDERPGTVAAHQIDHGVIATRFKRPSRSTVGLTPQTRMQVIDQSVYGGSVAALTRGDNALPENNPDGFRLGQRVQRFNLRRMYRPRIVHTDRPVPVRTAPDSLRSDPVGGVLSSPFPYGSFAKLRTMQRPLVRRVPAPQDQDVQFDGTDDNAFTPPQFFTTGRFG